MSARQPSGHALLIGASTRGLGGVEASVERFAALMESRGIVTTKLLSSSASRDEVMSTLDQIGLTLREDEPLVLYYAGHGHLWFPPDGHPPQVILILPGTRTSTGQSFLGILGPELTQKLRSLSEITRNITTIFDCCHSEAVLQGAEPDEATPRVLERLRRQAGAAIAARARRRASTAGPRGLDTIVRVVATSTYERAGGLGRGRDAVGLMTHTLVDVLEDHPGEPWIAVLARLRARVRARRRTQRPDVQGPWQRLPFSLERRTSLPELQLCLPVPEVWALQGTALLAAQPGDVYQLSSSPGSPLTVDARVIEVQPLRVVLQTQEPSSRILHGQEVLWAQFRRPHTPYLVRLCSSLAPERLHDAIDPRIYELSTSPDGRALAATLERDSARVCVHDYLGDRVAVLSESPTRAELEPWLLRASTFRRCVENLRYEKSFADAYTLRWGVEGSDEDLCTSGSSPASVASGSEIWIEISNSGRSYFDIFVAAYRIDSTRRFQAIFGPSSSGVQLRAGTSIRRSYLAKGVRGTHEGLIVTFSSHPLSLHDMHDEGEGRARINSRSAHGRARPARSTHLLLYRTDPYSGGTP